MKRELLNVNERNLVRFILKIQTMRIIEWESKNSCETKRNLVRFIVEIQTTRILE